METEYTWKQSVVATISEISNSATTKSLVTKAFLDIAHEWANLSVNQELPFNSCLCPDKTPVEFSIKQKFGQSPIIRFVTEPFYPGFKQKRSSLIFKITSI